jgi:regulatory protein
MESRQRYQASSPQTSRRSGSGGIDSFSDLLNSCLRLLSIRPRSRQEIEKHLHKYTSDSALINQIITKLTDLNYLDDKKFATWLIESRSRSSPRGKRLLLQELKSKGINIKEEPIAVDEANLAQKALEKKLILWKNLSYRDFRIKATRFLYSRGFSWEIIEKVLKKAYNDIHVS